MERRGDQKDILIFVTTGRLDRLLNSEMDFLKRVGE